jgi:hypothetical protein
MDGNELGVIVTTVGVLIGVLLEGWEHLEEWRKKGWRPVVPKIGFGILAISLAFEIWFDGRLAQDSANTKLRAALIEQSLAWRHLTPKQKRTMHDIFVQYPYGIGIVSTLLDPEAREYAEDFIEVEKGAHWETVVDIGWTRSDPGLFVATCDGGNSPITGLVEKALDAAHVPYKEIPLSSEDHTAAIGFTKGATYILVGHKPRD